MNNKVSCYRKDIARQRSCWTRRRAWLTM